MNLDTCFLICGATIKNEALFSELSVSDISFKLESIFLAKLLSIKSIFSSGFWRTDVRINCSRSGDRVSSGNVSLNLLSFCINNGTSLGLRASDISSFVIFCTFIDANSPRMTPKSEIGIVSSNRFWRIFESWCNGIIFGTTDCTKLGCVSSNLSKRACTSSCPRRSAA